MLAPSWLESARTRLSEPVCRVLTIALVKSWRVCTTERLEPNAAACDRRLPRAAVKLVKAVLMSLSVWNLLVDAAMPRPAESYLTPEIDWEDVPFSLNTTLRLSPPSRLTPL